MFETYVGEFDCVLINALITQQIFQHTIPRMLSQTLLQLNGSSMQSENRNYVDPLQCRHITRPSACSCANLWKLYFATAAATQTTHNIKPKRKLSGENCHSGYSCPNERWHIRCVDARVFARIGRTGKTLDAAY